MAPVGAAEQGHYRVVAELPLKLPDNTPGLALTVASPYSLAIFDC
jgi:hypothetical protein